MASHPVDPQAARVYAMERCELRGHMAHRMPLRKLQTHARVACDRAKVPRVRVRFLREHGVGGAYTLYEDGSTDITLCPKRGANLCALAHELAHHIAWCKSPRSQPHGPTWMWWYAALMDTMRLVPFEGTLAICRRHGVAIAPVGGVKRPIT